LSNLDVTLSPHHRWLLAAVIALMTLAAARAQEPPAGAEDEEQAKTYYDLRRSKNRLTRSAANHYLNLVGLQEWSDWTGKSKVMAKYVDHDPDLAWVKLQVVRVEEGKRDVKEITVPVAKLSEKCQSRLRQIDKQKEKLDALLTADDDPQTSAGAPFVDPGAPMTDERGAEPGAPSERPPVEHAAFPGPQPPPVEQPPAPEEFEVDPLGFAEMDLGPPPALGGPEGMVPPGQPGSPAVEGASPDDADQPAVPSER
jgi:hypothetical protein